MQRTTTEDKAENSKEDKSKKLEKVLTLAKTLRKIEEISKKLINKQLSIFPENIFPFYFAFGAYKTLTDTYLDKETLQKFDTQLVSPSSVDLMKSCLTPKREDRPSMAKVCDELEKEIKNENKGHAQSELQKKLEGLLEVSQYMEPLLHWNEKVGAIEDPEDAKKLPSKKLFSEKNFLAVYGFLIIETLGECSIENISMSVLFRMFAGIRLHDRTGYESNLWNKLLQYDEELIDLLRNCLPTDNIQKITLNQITDLLSKLLQIEIAKQKALAEQSHIPQTQSHIQLGNVFARYNKRGVRVADPAQPVAIVAPKSVPTSDEPILAQAAGFTRAKKPGGSNLIDGLFGLRAGTQTMTSQLAVADNKSVPASTEPVAATSVVNNGEQSSSVVQQKL